MKELLKQLKGYRKLRKFIKKHPINENDNIPQRLFEATLKINKINVEVDPKFETYGVMIDLSGGAVFKIDYLKDIILKLALLGVNQVWLYVEDNYYIENEPFFGYLRGRYSKQDLRELDSYAHTLGVELVLAIQTLGHMEHFLQWERNQRYADQPDILMVRDSETTRLIRKMLQFAKDSFATTRIHIGLDEVANLGHGQFIKKYGPYSQEDIYMTHLKEISTIAKEIGFTEVLIWPDMLFQLSNNYKGYHIPQTQFSSNIRYKFPQDTTLVYWDYENTDVEAIKQMILKHRELSDNIIMASALWTRHRPYYDHLQTQQTAPAHIEAALDLGIKEMIFTIWNNDGAPVDFDSVFLGVTRMSEAVLLNNYNLDKVYKYIFKNKINRVEQKSEINNIPINPIGVLYDDPILGIYLNNEMAKSPDRIVQSYEYLETLPKIRGRKNKEYNVLKEILLLKLKMRAELISKHQGLRSKKPLIKDAERLCDLLHEYSILVRKRWLSHYLPYGLDIHDYRISGQIARYETLIYRIRKKLPFPELSEINDVHQKIEPEFEKIHSSYKTL